MNSTESLPDDLKIIIADDHPIFRKGIEASLKFSPGIKLITQASDGEAVLKLLEQDSYDIVFMDIKMSPMNGIKATEKIQERFPDVKVIALSMHDEEEYVVDILKKGAAGYLLKNADRAELLLAMRHVLAGESYFSKEISKLLQQKLNQLLVEGELSPDVNLDHQWIREFIFLICHEFKNNEIAGLLNKSTRTIEGYRNKIIRKTGSTNIIGVVKYGIAHHILDDTELKIKFRDAIAKKQG